MYKILAQSQGGHSIPEQIDQAEGIKEARELVSQYKLAYGSYWKVWHAKTYSEAEQAEYLFNMFLNAKNNN